MRRLLYLAISVIVLTACSQGHSADEQAAKAAKHYYDELLSGGYSEFVSGMSRTENIPGPYRQQLVDNAKMFMARQQREHGGIREVRVMNAEADTSAHTAHVFLVLCFGDSTNEEVCVPMVESQGKWLMR